LRHTAQDHKVVRVVLSWCLAALQVETYFGYITGTRVLDSYWIGLERDYSALNSVYMWPDGTSVGNGYVSNVDPVGGKRETQAPALSSRHCCLWQCLACYEHVC
jgi:hypothetical protein